MIGITSVPVSRKLKDAVKCIGGSRLEIMARIVTSARNRAVDHESGSHAASYDTLTLKASTILYK